MTQWINKNKRLSKENKCIELKTKSFNDVSLRAILITLIIF